MRSKPRKKKAKQLSYRKNWKSCSTAKTRVRMLPPFLQPSFALRLLFEALPLTVTGRQLRFAWLFLALRLALRGRAIPAAHLRMLPSHLSITRAHLGITRHLVHRMGSLSGASSSGSFAGVQFGLVSPSGSHVVALISGLGLVPICSTVTCCLSCACSLEITFGCVPDFVSTFACPRSSCGPQSLGTLALPSAFASVE